MLLTSEYLVIQSECRIMQRMQRMQLKKIAHKTLTGFMAVWLSGVVFLLCCAAMNSRVMAAESCPLAKMSAHCDKATKANTNAAVIELISENTAECCGFLPAVFDKARKLERVTEQLAITPESVKVKVFVAPIQKIFSAIPAIRSHVADRHGTFIRNCVFRI